MCDPMTLLAGASAIAGGVGKLGSGFANSDLAKFQAQFAQGNEQLALGQGQLAAAKGAQDIGRTATAVNSTVGAQRVAAAGSNLNPDWGSPLLAQANSILQGQGDMAIINARTAAAQASANANAASAAGQVAGLNMQASNDIMSGYFGAATTMLSAADSHFNNPWSKILGPGGSYGAPTVGSY